MPSRTKIPRSLRIAGYHLNVRLVPKTTLLAILNADDEPGTMYGGCFDNHLGENGHNGKIAGTIYINKKMPSKERWDVFWHELDHALNDIRSWDLSLR